MKWNEGMGKMGKWGLLVLCLALLYTPSAMGQAAGTGTIQGTVRDPQGLPVPGAEVTVRSIETGAERKLTTSDQGTYSAPFLRPGAYVVIVKKDGFANVEKKDLNLSVGQVLDASIDLPVKGAQETVTVTTDQPLVETEKTEVSQVINQAQVGNLPLNGRRWDNLALLTPGVAEDGGFGLITFRGISALYNNNMVDGADNNQAFFSEARGRTRIAYGYSINSIKEFQVQTAAYSAEYGRAAGGVVNAVTKSGTNEWHGDAFYFIRDKAFLALDSFAKSRGTTTKPEERRQQFGGSVGGPIVKEKLFLFLNYDQQKRSFPVIHVANDAQFFNFASGGSQADLCDNATPAATLNTLAQCQAVLDSLNPITILVAPRQGNQSLGLAKLDYQIDPNNHLSGVFNILRWDSPNGIQSAVTLTGLSPLANGSDKVENEFITVTYNRVISSTIVNEAKFQYGRDFESQVPNASGPQIQITGGTNFGMPNSLPRGRFPNEKRFQWADNVSIVHGRHTWKFGVDINHVRDNIQNLFNGGGIYSYSGTTALRNYVFDLNHPGARNYSTFTQAADPITGNGEGFFTTNDYNVYFQDNFKFRPNLSFNLGFRYEVQAMPKPVVPNPLVPENAVLNTDTNNFGPRIGFSWGIGKSQKQVLRGGYGIYYGRTQNSTIFVHMFQNGVFQRTVSFGGTQVLPVGCPALTVPNVLFPLPNTAPSFGPIYGSSGPTPTNIFTGFQDFTTRCPTLTSTITLQTLDPKFENPMVQQYDLAYERELPWKMGLTVSYVGSRGNFLPMFYDVNLPAPTGTATYLVFDGSGNPEGTPNSFTVPFFFVNAANPRPRAAAGVTGPLVMGKSIINSWYNGVVVRVRRQSSNGLSFDVNYTYSQSRDNGQVLGTFGTFFGTDSPLNPYDLRNEYGLSDTDIRNRFIMNVYWVAPFANWTDSPALKHVIGGWKFAGVTKIQDGRPITAQMGGRPSCAGNSISSIPSGSGQGGLTCGASSNSGGGINGRVPFFERNSLYTGFGLMTFDLRIARVFKINERSDVEFLWEAFNLFNRGNVTAVQTSLYDFVNRNTNTAPFGTTLGCLNAGAGIADFNGCLVRRAAPHIPAAADGFRGISGTGNTLYTARQMQFGLKFRY